MRAFEQIAIKTLNIRNRIKSIGSVYAFDGVVTKKESTEWVEDQVHAVHVFLNPAYALTHVGSAFDVLLAFNYDFIPGRELELIQLLSGETVQINPGMTEPTEGISHFGYHIPDKARLLTELDWWNSLGFSVAQVSVTTSHSNTDKRYLYAFIDTRVQVGVFTKVISRMTYPRGLESLVEEFEHVNRHRF